MPATPEVSPTRAALAPSSQGGPRRSPYLRDARRRPRLGVRRRGRRPGARRPRPRRAASADPPDPRAVLDPRPDRRRDQPRHQLRRGELPHGSRPLEKQGLLEIAFDGRPRRYRLAIEYRRNKILRAARAIPHGRWASYGDVGVVATSARNAARAVARSAAHNPAFPNPWRVLDRDGAIPDGWRGYGGGPEKCRELLEAEGIGFEGGHADPARRIGWEELEGLVEADDQPAEAAA